MSDPNGKHLTPAWLSIGSNVGDREQRCLEAVRAIGDSGAGRPTRLSSLYETDPVDCAPMRPFVNLAVEVEALLSPTDLLERLQAVEKEMGRSGGHSEPREIDIDIIAMGDCVLRGETLALPHPRYSRRRFVLVPLREIVPGFICPSSGRSIDDMIGQLPPGDGVERITARRFVSSSDSRR
jgi:2-amino-4-hydroxy-6-hydroxymethyldihydropteridine diphosphokinase